MGQNTKETLGTDLSTLHKTIPFHCHISTLNMIVVLTLVTTDFAMVLGNSFITSSTLRLRATLFFIWTK